MIMIKILIASLVSAMLFSSCAFFANSDGTEFTKTSTGWVINEKVYTPGMRIGTAAPITDYPKTLCRRVATYDNLLHCKSPAIVYVDTVDQVEPTVRLLKTAPVL